MLLSLLFYTSIANNIRAYTDNKMSTCLGHKEQISDNNLKNGLQGTIINYTTNSNLSITIMDQFPNHVILTGHQIMNLVLNFEYLLLSCFLTGALLSNIGFITMDTLYLVATYKKCICFYETDFTIS